MTDIHSWDKARLPDAVYDLAMRLGVKPDCTAAAVRLIQIGRMKRKLEGEAWMGFTATQTIAADRCGFDWQAKAGPLGLISVRDALVDGEARLDVQAFGFLPLAHAPHTASLLRGELLRYLAEMPWAPHAILHNPALTWRVDGPETLAVSAGVGDAASEVVLTLGTEGRVAGAFAADRPRSATAPILPTPWRGRFSDYRSHHAIWLPFAGEVAWEINGQAVTYWQGQIVDWEMQEKAK